jgi:predicted nucleic acid-binding protein
MKFLDTSFLIDIIQGYAPAKDILNKLDKEGPQATNTIVVHEFLVGAYGGMKLKAERKIREELLRKLIILPFDFKSAKESAKIESRLREQGKYPGWGRYINRRINKSKWVNNNSYKKYQAFQKHSWNNCGNILR